VTIHAPATATYNTSFTVAATGGDSGNPVTFSSTGACSNSGATFTMTSGTGTCTVKYDQAGNANYAAAAQVVDYTTAQPASQVINVSIHAPATAVYNTSFTVAATGGASGNPVTFSSSGVCTNVGATFTMTSGIGTCTVKYNQAGNANYAAAEQVIEATIAQGWNLSGFYQPVDMTPASATTVWNTVKGGSTVPLKFNVYTGSTELKDTSRVKSLTATTLACSSGLESTVDELSATGGTSLRYDTTGGQFIFNWQTAKAANNCYKVTMTTQDGSTLFAYFKTK